MRRHERGHRFVGEGILAGHGGWADLMQGGVVGAVGAGGCEVGAVGREMGAEVVTRCDRSPRADWSGRMSSWVVESLATIEESSWRLIRSS